MKYAILIVLLTVIVGLTGCVGGGVKDCGDDPICFALYAKTCSPAIATLNDSGITTSLEIKGGTDDACEISVMIDEFESVPAFEGKEMTCAIPTDAITFDSDLTTIELLDSCTGELADMLKSLTKGIYEYGEESGNNNGIGIITPIGVVTNETSVEESMYGIYATTGQKFQLKLGQPVKITDLFDSHGNPYKIRLAGFWEEAESSTDSTDASQPVVTVVVEYSDAANGNWETKRTITNEQSVTEGRAVITLLEANENFEYATFIVFDGGSPTEQGQIGCEPTSFMCSDGTKVSWCICTDSDELKCIENPKTACPSQTTCEEGAITEKICSGGMLKYSVCINGQWKTEYEACPIPTTIAQNGYYVAYCEQNENLSTTYYASNGKCGVKTVCFDGYAHDANGACVSYLTNQTEECEPGATAWCTTSQGCTGMKFCVMTTSSSGTIYKWSGCVDMPDDGCPTMNSSSGGGGGASVPTNETSSGGAGGNYSGVVNATSTNSSSGGGGGNSTSTSGMNHSTNGS
ncbi:MAG: hypothetical protein V1911_03565 [Candidatus Micrarchaeota archaeon]